MNIGILQRGKSLEKLSKIINNFDIAYIVNNFEGELKKFETFLKNKTIIHFCNSMGDAALKNNTYKKFNINEVVLSFTKQMIDENKRRNIKTIKGYYNPYVKKISILPNEYTKIVKIFRNTGIGCIHYVSEVIKPDNIWIIGLDFYETNYMIKPVMKYQKEKSKDIKMLENFMNIVKNNTDIKYNILSYSKRLKNMENLKIIK